MKQLKWIWPLLTLTLAVGLGYYFGAHLDGEAKFVPIVKTYKINKSSPMNSGASLILAPDVTVSGHIALELPTQNKKVRYFVAKRP